MTEKQKNDILYVCSLIETCLLYTSREKKARVKELHTVKSNLSQILQGEKDREKKQIGRASCRERVCHYV